MSLNMVPGPWQNVPGLCVPWGLCYSNRRRTLWFIVCVVCMWENHRTLFITILRTQNIKPWINPSSFAVLQIFSHFLFTWLTSRLKTQHLRHSCIPIAALRCDIPQITIPPHTCRNVWVRRAIIELVRHIQICLIIPVFSHRLLIRISNNTPLDFVWETNDLHLSSTIVTFHQLG